MRHIISKDAGNAYKILKRIQWRVTNPSIKKRYDITRVSAFLYFKKRVELSSQKRRF